MTTLGPLGQAASEPLPPFDQVPQGFKPTLATLPLMLSETAFALVSSTLWPTLDRWTNGAWRHAQVDVSHSAFSLYLESNAEREICIQIGRADLRQGGTIGQHPLKLLINLIWAAERVWERGTVDGRLAETDYAGLDSLIRRLVEFGQMSIRGIRADLGPGDPEWEQCLRTKLRGDERRRPELVLVRKWRGREDWGWNSADNDDERQVLGSSLCAIEEWLGPGPYRTVKRRATKRKVPGSLP